jgi:hypothetical protein
VLYELVFHRRAPPSVCSTSRRKGAVCVIDVSATSYSEREREKEREKDRQREGCSSRHLTNPWTRVKHACMRALHYLDACIFACVSTCACCTCAGMCMLGSASSAVSLIGYG